MDDNNPDADLLVDLPPVGMGKYIPCRTSLYTGSSASRRYAVIRTKSLPRSSTTGSMIDRRSPRTRCSTSPCLGVDTELLSFASQNQLIPPVRWYKARRSLCFSIQTRKLLATVRYTSNKIISGSLTTTESTIGCAWVANSSWREHTYTRVFPPGPSIRRSP